jgi:hypothetical protein
MSYSPVLRRMDEEGIRLVVDYGASVWEIQQKGAQEHYVFARSMLCKPVLMDARCGQLTRDWRTRVTADDLGRPLELRYADGNELVALEIATMDVQPWEPHTGVGWRIALEAWYATIKWLDDSRIQTKRPTAGPTAPLAVQEFEEKLRENPVIAHFDARVAEGQRRWRDWHGAWYYAGLAAGGLDMDWRGWYRDRIATWTSDSNALAGPSAIAELDKLESGRLDHMETLPAYWMNNELG